MRTPEQYRIMVADDDASIRESLRKSLQSEGYQVIVAANGAEAVEIIRAKPNSADLLLVDLNMPLKNGWVALHQLLEINSTLPVFVITGLSHQRELAESAGVRALVEKPIDVPGLLQLIRKQLSNPVLTHSCEHITFSRVPAGGFNALLRPLLGKADVHDHWGLNE
jgi:CheY-like chemotaxis protein